jgi:hypothetical protein
MSVFEGSKRVIGAVKRELEVAQHDVDLSCTGTSSQSGLVEATDRGYDGQSRMAGSIGFHGSVHKHEFQQLTGCFPMCHGAHQVVFQLRLLQRLGARRFVSIALEKG